MFWLVMVLAQLEKAQGVRQTGDIAEKWLHDARLEAIESDAEQWEQWREETGAPEPATENG